MKNIINKLKQLQKLFVLLLLHKRLLVLLLKLILPLKQLLLKNHQQNHRDTFKNEKKSAAKFIFCLSKIKNFYLRSK